MIEIIISSEKLIIPSESYIINKILYFYQHFYKIFNSNEEKNDLKEVVKYLLHHIQYKSISGDDIQTLVNSTILESDEIMKIYQLNSCNNDNQKPFVKHNRYYYRILYINKYKCRIY